MVSIEQVQPILDVLGTGERAARADAAAALARLPLSAAALRSLDPAVRSLVREHGKPPADRVVVPADRVRPAAGAERLVAMQLSRRLRTEAFDPAGRPRWTDADLARLRSLAPAELRRLFTALVGQATRLPGAARDRAARALAPLPARLGVPSAVDVPAMVELHLRSRVLPAEQVGRLLAAASDTVLLAGFRDSLRDPRRRDGAVELLRITLEQREVPAAGRRPVPRKAVRPPGRGPRGPEAAGITGPRGRPDVDFDGGPGGWPGLGGRPMPATEPHFPLPTAEPPPTFAEPPPMVDPPPDFAGPPPMVEPPADTAEPPPTMAEPPPATAERPPATAEPPPAAVEPDPAPAEERRIQAEVAHTASGRRRTHAFVPAADHTVSVHIGPDTVGTLALGTAFPDRQVEPQTPAGAVLDVEFVATGPDGTTARQRQALLLPPTGPTTRAVFTLPVAAGATDVRASVLVFQGARLLQSAELRGPVGTADREVGGETLRLASTAEFDTTPTPGRPAVDASLSFHVGTPVEALSLDARGAGGIVSLGGVEALKDEIVLLLREAVAADADDGATPGSPQQVALLRGLAQQGHTLHQELRAQLGDVTIKNSVQLTTPADQVVPLEFVYDRGFPSDTARLCRNWHTALATGRCRCRARDGLVQTVCPLGFWGLRLTIERQLAGQDDGVVARPGQPAPGRTTLPDLTRVLFAASAVVDRKSAGQRERTIALLTERVGAGLKSVESWRAWHQAVATHRPGLLLSLPHNLPSAAGLPTLEIGRDSRLPVAALTPRHVLTDATPVGPVVMLLGCTTAEEKVAWQSAAVAFRRRGAAVVVGTLAETLGRQSAPMARLLADALWGTDRIAGQTMGELMRLVRRRLVAQGATLGMSLVAFGHTEWTVPEGRR